MKGMLYTHFLFMHADINECDHSNGGCQHNCINTAGSYYCTCTDPAGYTLNGDGHSCSGKQYEVAGEFNIIYNSCTVLNYLVSCHTLNSMYNIAVFIKAIN